MPVKLIASYEIDDTQLKKAVADFDKLQKVISKTGISWLAVDKTNKEIRGSTSKMLQVMQEQTAALRTHTSLQKAIADSSKNTALNWTTAANKARDLATSIKSSTTSLLKWTGIGTAVSGLLGIGSLWGFEHLAAHANAGLKSSRGLGLSYGAQQAFNTSFGRVIDPSSFINAISTGKGNIQSEEAAALFQLHINPMTSGDTESTAIQALREIHKRARATKNDYELGMLLQQGAGPFTDLQGLRNLKGTSESELDKYLKQHNLLTDQLRIEEATLKKMQEFDVELDAAGKKIKATFITGLADLAPELQELARGLSDAVGTFVRSPMFKEAIASLTSGLHSLASYIGTPDFQDDIKSFAANIGLVAEATLKVARFIVGPAAADTIRGRRQEQNRNAFGGGKKFLPDGTEITDNAGDVRDGLRNNLSLEQLFGLTEKLEASGVNAVSPKGAIGKHQIMPGTAIGLGYSPGDMFDPKLNDEAARKLLTELSEQYKGNTRDILIAYNAGPDWVKKFHASGDNISILPKETQNYLARAGGGEMKIILMTPEGVKLPTQTAQVSIGYAR